MSESKNVFLYFDEYSYIYNYAKKLRILTQKRIERIKLCFSDSPKRNEILKKLNYQYHLYKALTIDRGSLYGEYEKAQNVKRNCETALIFRNGDKTHIEKLNRANERLNCLKLIIKFKNSCT